MIHLHGDLRLKQYLFLPAVYLIDTIAGDPEWFPHPVRLMGQVITRGEILLRRPNESEREQFITGAALSIALIIAAYCITAQLIKTIHRRSHRFGVVIELLLGWTCLASRSLDQEASTVIAALTNNDIWLARHKLARIVGRDTEELSEREVSRALIETLAESASDGIIAPIFYMAIGGVPLAMAYKAASTLDSMIGHTNQQYFYFGKLAARLDDIANFIPARLTALAIIATSCLPGGTDRYTALRVWRRDRAKHQSPNAGQPESAMSGALRVQLGGRNTYAGEIVSAQIMGLEFQGATPEKATQARYLVSIVCACGIFAGVLFAILPRTSRETYQ